MPAVALVQIADDFTYAKLDEVRAMIGERRTKWGLSALSWGTPNPQGEDITIARINVLRAGLEAAIVKYYNTAVHPSGNLENAPAITTWTKATLLAALGLGGLDGFGNRNWTNVPADGDAGDLAEYVSNLYGTDLITGPFLYKVWLNELILAARALTHFSIGVTVEEGKYMPWPATGTSSASCAAALEACNADYPGMTDGFEPPGVESAPYVQVESSFAGGWYAVTGKAQSGKIRANLTGRTGTGKLFFQAYLRQFMSAISNNPPVTGDGKFHLYHELASGENYLSPRLGEPGSPAFEATLGCPYPSAREGWGLYPLIAFAPTFTYT